MACSEGIDSDFRVYSRKESPRRSALAEQCLTAHNPSTNREASSSEREDNLQSSQAGNIIVFLPAAEESRFLQKYQHKPPFRSLGLQPAGLVDLDPGPNHQDGI